MTIGIEDKRLRTQCVSNTIVKFRMMRILLILGWLFKTMECQTCSAPEFTGHDGVHFIPSMVYINEGDMAIVQCEVEYDETQQQPLQCFMYVNDCQMEGFNHPRWIIDITELNAPCTISSSPHCRILTMYINGTAEAQNSRVYCCARLGSRKCSSNSTVSVMQPTPTADHNTLGIRTNGSPKPAVSTSSIEMSSTPTSNSSSPTDPITDPRILAVSEASQNLMTSLSLITSLITGHIAMSLL